MRSLVVVPCVFGCIEYTPERLEPPVWPPPHRQDLPPDVVTDTIVQVTAPKVDVLWVIDDSCSMDDEQQAIAVNEGEFLDYFLGSDLDYHIGVVTHDPRQQGQLVPSGALRWIDAETQEPFATFADMVLLGTDGSGCEQGLATSFMALEVQEDGANEGFLRDDAAIHTIVISDEPDQSDGDPVTKDEYVDWYDGLKPTPEDRSFSAIASPNPIADCTSNPVNFLDVAAEIGGVSWDISDADWPQVLELLGLQAAGLRREYFLSQLPDATTIDVWVEVPSEGRSHYVQGEAPDGDYAYAVQRNSIVFDTYTPPAGATVEITYETRDSVVVEDTVGSGD